MKIEKFEDVEAWIEARELVRAVYRMTGNSRDFGLNDQIRRSAVSIMANIAEGFDRGYNKEFVRFLNIASASVSETKSHLYVFLDQNYVKEDEFDAIYGRCESVRKLLNGFIRYLRKADHSA